MVLIINTCTNDHELADNGDVKDVDKAIMRCGLAVSNIACQHCTKKYFSESPLEEALLRIEKIQENEVRKRLFLQLTLLRNVGELMDRFRAYGKTRNPSYQQKIEEKYPVFMNFWGMYKERNPEQNNFRTDYEKLFSRCTDFLIDSMRKLKKGREIDMDSFLSIKTERDAMLTIWLQCLEEAEAKLSN